MKVSRCVCEGYSGADNERYQEMCEIVEKCKELKISPPEEAMLYIDRYDKGEESSVLHLRPQIDKGVSTRDYGESKAIIINLNEIDENIDFIRIFHEEFEE